MGEVRYMISEAAKQVHVESYVLRYWEEELNLKIGRTEMGHRYYTEDDIQLFCCIKKLKNEGMLLKDLKPLIPKLQETRNRLTAPPEPVHEKKEETQLTTVAASLRPTEAEVIPVTQLEQVRGLIGDVLTEVVTTNNTALEKSISKKVTDDVIREMDFLFQAKERQEEEHYRKLDTLIRQQQANRKEYAARSTPLGKLKRILT